MQIFQTTTNPKKAREEVARIEGIIQDLEAQQKAKEGELEGLEASAGDEVLAAVVEGDGAARSQEVASAIALKRAEVDTTMRAAEAARRQLKGARIQVLLADATDLRKRAAKLREEAAERRKKTDELLAALKEHEGCEYIPKPPDRPSLGDTLSGGAPTVIYRIIPQTDLMLQEVAGYEHQAAALEAQAGQHTG
jgi:DNA repair exonuclease SbcCD ATPase subunit